MALTSEELNYLVWRYLQESGFSHAAFALNHESSLSGTKLDVDHVPPGALVSFVQKGIQYMEMEANLNDDNDGVEGEFARLSAHDIMTNDIPTLKSLLADKKEKLEKDRELRRQRRAQSRMERHTHQEVSPAQTCTLEGHEKDVFICAWSPAGSLLASGSGDATARIWDTEHGNTSVVMPHVLPGNPESEKTKDVTTLDWNVDGSLLATGSYDGYARIWNSAGVLQVSCAGHEGPIFSLKWSKRGDLLLSGSVDKTSIIWDGRTGEMRQRFRFHTAPVLDVDWSSHNTFATCSTDQMIFVCRVGEQQPVHRFEGHSDEVNAVKWNSTGTILASCSDDNTARVWSTSSASCIHRLAEHTKEIYTIKWSNTGPGTANPQARLLLVTASFDATIRLWEMDTGTCVNTLIQHTHPVYSVAFSPDGLWLASGSFDKQLHIWSVQGGALVRTFKGAGGIFEVCWNREGTRVAACFSNKTIAVIDPGL
ncbi:hypothetical protein WJX74_003493 [Apatococcus lobatus]|uniref:Uncharacterized protein n=1 Tax=Apatococcus lobatus TaxID=904363 RepID=A0AAW1RAR1_9CHLO